MTPEFDYSFFFDEQAATADGATDVVWLRDLFRARALDILRRVQTAQELTPMLEFQRQRRNRVQGRIVAASDAACDVYKRSLNSTFSTTNFRFGSSATIAGGLGAIFTGEDAARAFAGTAGILSGVRAEYSDAFFRNKVVEVLTQAMDIGRERKLDEIQRKGSLLLIDYTIEEAISDALHYNAACTMIAGLQETQEALHTTADPGLKWLANAFGGVASNEKATQALFESLGKAVGTIQEIERANEAKNTVVTDGDQGDDDPPATQPSTQPQAESETPSESE